MFDPTILLQDAQTTALTPLGWVFLLVSTLSVTILVIWCFYRVLTLPPEERPPAPPPGFGP